MAGKSVWMCVVLVAVASLAAAGDSQHGEAPLLPPPANRKTVDSVPPVAPPPPVPAPDVAPPPASLPHVLPPAAPEVLTPWPDNLCPAPGIFAAIDFGILVPHLKHALVAPVTLNPGGFADTVAPPTGDLDTTVAPRIVLGWRLPRGLGAALLTYRNIASEGWETLPGYDAAGDGLLRTRLDMSFVDLAYATREVPLGALWSIRWEIGTRILAAYSDARAQGLVLGQRSSNHFVGAGPQIALDVTREFPGTGLALFTRTDAAEMLGRVRQKFAESVGDPQNPILFGATNRSGAQGVPHLNVQAGLSWLSHPDGRFRVTCGYHWEQLWAIASIDDSRGDVRTQGFFLRSEFNY